MKVIRKNTNSKTDRWGGKRTKIRGKCEGVLTRILLAADMMQRVKRISYELLMNSEGSYL